MGTGKRENYRNIEMMELTIFAILLYMRAKKEIKKKSLSLGNWGR